MIRENTMDKRSIIDGFAVGLRLRGYAMLGTGAWRDDLAG